VPLPVVGRVILGVSVEGEADQHLRSTAQGVDLGVPFPIHPTRSVVVGPPPLDVRRESSAAPPVGRATSLRGPDTY
jgi:hypothetical protein